MTQTSRHFQLSAAQLKRTHPWRHASEKPKDIPSTPILDDHNLGVQLSVGLYITKGPLSYNLAHWCQIDGFKERWDLLMDKYDSLENLRASLTPLDVALILTTKNLHHNYFERTFSPLFSLLEMSRDPEAAMRFLLDAIAQLREVHPHTNVHMIDNGSIFTQIESFLALTMRGELCHVSQEIYEAIHAHARHLHGTQDNRLDTFLAILFPEETQWGNQAIATWSEVLETLQLQQHPYNVRGALPHLIILEPLFACGADIPHMRLLARAKHISIYLQRDDERWDALLDLLITHDRDAIPVLVDLLASKHAPSLNEQPMFGLLNATSEPTLLVAFARGLAHQYAIKKATRERLIKHLHTMPELVITHLPPLLDELEATKGESKAFAAIKALVEKHQSRKQAIEQEATQQHLYIDREALPEALRELPWHKGKKEPKLPRFFAPLLFPKLLVREDPSLALPLELYEDIGRILKSRDETLLDALQSFVDPESMSRFCVHLFQEWDKVGHPGKEDWVSDALLRFGQTALTKTLHDPMDLWLSYSASHPGKTILSRLRAGDPYHLELLDSLHHASYLDDARRAARSKLTVFAREAKLGEDEAAIEALLDSRTPTLGVSPAGRLSLVGHQESFLVKVDETLEPMLVEDEDALDDVTTMIWEHSKNLFRHQFLHMTHRLERALTTQRRWELSRWRAHILGHPLIANLAKRLIWCDFATSGEHNLRASPPRFWRLDESLECVDLDDNRIEPEEHHAIALAHPMDMSPEQRQAWLLTLGDYEIVQPFEQLQRRIYEGMQPPQNLTTLLGKTSPHERLRHLYTMLPWETIPLGTKSSRFGGYRIYLLLEDGKHDRGAFKIVLDQGIHKDARKRKQENHLENFVRLEKVPWERVDPIQRSELFVGLFDTFAPGTQPIK